MSHGDSTSEETAESELAVICLKVAVSERSRPTPSMDMGADAVTAEDERGQGNHRRRCVEDESG
jgi:hypothetical protein